ncbi:MAG: hypothetical protein FWH53_00815 [Leptospirales bacterium]|nr:hypothetical protein [Leptospirales bacterium]
MASKVEYAEFGNIEAEIAELAKKSVIAGVVAEEGSLLAKYAGANEFSARITPKKGKFLAVPLLPELEGKSPKDFPAKFFRFVPFDPKNIWKGGKLISGDTPAFVLLRSVKIPERAFIRKAADNKKTKEKVEEIMRVQLEKILLGEASADDLFVAAGEMIVSRIRGSISSNIKPENKPLTKIFKKGNRTLIDSGDMLKSIGYEIEG